MFPFRSRLFIPALLALWLAATHHCGLEAAGVFAGDDRGGPECCAASQCAADTCATIEDGAYLRESDAPGIVPPVAAVVVATVVVPREVSGLAAADRRCWSDFGRRRAHVVGWQFLERSALPPGAPSPA